MLYQTKKKTKKQQNQPVQPQPTADTDMQSDAGSSVVGSSAAAHTFLRCGEEVDANEIELICTSFDTNEEVHEKYADFASTEPKLQR